MCIRDRIRKMVRTLIQTAQTQGPYVWKLEPEIDAQFAEYVRHVKEVNDRYEKLVVHPGVTDTGKQTTQGKWDEFADEDINFRAEVHMAKAQIGRLLGEALDNGDNIPGYMAPASPVAAAGGAAAGGTSATADVGQALRPEMLAEEATPVQFRHWARAVRQYVMDSFPTVSETSKCSLVVKRMAPAWQADLARFVDDNVRLDGPGGLFSEIESRIMTKYPVNVRCQTFSNYVRKEGSSFTSYINELVDLADECEYGLCCKNRFIFNLSLIHI